MDPIPFPNFNYRDPSPADLRWQVYATLAYGGQGIFYLPTASPMRKTIGTVSLARTVNARPNTAWCASST
jgi:hypothetical protein